MKRILSIAVIAAFMTSCGAKTADDVNVDDIKTACDCIDAMDVIANDMLSYIGEKSEKEMKDDEALNSKFDKLREVEKKCRKDFKKEDAEKCDGYSDFEETMNKFAEKF